MLSLKQATQAYVDGSQLVTVDGKMIIILDVDTNVDSDHVTEQQALGKYNWWVSGEDVTTGQECIFSTKVGSEIQNLSLIQS